MDLPLVLEKLGIVENVAPDMSSYEAMVDTWRGKTPPPTMQECEDTWALIQPEVQASMDAVVEKKELMDNGVNDSTKLDAVWQFLRTGDKSILDNFQAKIDEVTK